MFVHYSPTVPGNTSPISLNGLVNCGAVGFRPLPTCACTAVAAVRTSISIQSLTVCGWRWYFHFSRSTLHFNGHQLLPVPKKRLCAVVLFFSLSSSSSFSPSAQQMKWALCTDRRRRRQADCTMAAWSIFKDVLTQSQLSSERYGVLKQHWVELLYSLFLSFSFSCTELQS